MSEITRFDELFAEDAAVVREIIRKSGELPRLEPGAFRDGFIAGITDMAARADCAVGDGGHQLQDIAEQITMLVSGEAFLVHHPIDPVDATADKQRAIIETIPDYVDAAWELSTWTACINWNGKGNEKEWLDELREKIELVQNLTPSVRAALAAAKEQSQ